MFKNLTDGVRQLFFPDNCLLCRSYLNSNHQEQLCATCKSSIIENIPPSCIRCSIHLEAHGGESLCESCQTIPLAIDRLWAACAYTEPIPQLIHAFKYHGKTALHQTFVKLLHHYIETRFVPLEDVDIMAPIPLHPVRLRERGYNQAELLSFHLSNRLNLHHQPSLLKRVTPSVSQTTLDRKQRWTNLQGAFKMNPSFTVADKNILLVDDLLTTKATANAAAIALKEAGAAQVNIITLAIA